MGDQLEVKRVPFLFYLHGTVNGFLTATAINNVPPTAERGLAHVGTFNTDAPVSPTHSQLQIEPATLEYRDDSLTN